VEEVGYDLEFGSELQVPAGTHGRLGELHRDDQGGGW